LKTFQSLILTPKIFFFIYLYICTTFSGQVSAQNLYLNLIGKDSLETRLINNTIEGEIFNDFKAIKTALDSLENHLEKKGYIALEREVFQKISDSVFFARYNLNTLYSQIKINQTARLLDFGITSRELQSISLIKEVNHIVIPFENVEWVLRFLNKSLSERGDPFAVVKLENIIPSNKAISTLEADLVIELKSIRKVTAVRVVGYEKFPRAFLKYTAGIKKGMLFQKDKINERSYLLENLGFVRNVKSPEVLFTEEGTELYLYLEKKSNNSFDGIIGFTTNEESNRLELNGYVNLQLSNNLNFGEQLLLQYKNDGAQQEHFQVNVELPFIFQSPLGVELGLDFFKRDSTFLTVERNALVNYHFNTRTKIFAGYRDYESENLLDSLQAGNSIENFNASFFVFGGNYSISQRSSIFPVKTKFLISNELGVRNVQKVKTDQYRLSLRANHIFNLNDNNSIFINNQTGYLKSENYLTNELFRFGGINSIRGFDENSIDASLFSVLNTEYRFLLTQNTYIHTITDLAYFENKVTELKNQIYSFGLGMGLQTNAGLFKINIANGALEGQNFKFSNTKFHFSLSSRF